MPYKSGQSVEITASIAASASLSDSCAIGVRQLLGIIIPSIEAAAITFQASSDGTNFYDVYNAAALTEVTIPASTHNHAYDVPLELLAYPYIKVRSGTSSSPITQSAAVSITLVVG